MRNDIEDVLKQYGISTFGNKKGIERVESQLWNDEQVVYIVPTNAIIHDVNTASKEKLPGVFALTSKRILFSYKMGFSEKTETFELSEIKNVDSYGNGISGGHIKIDTITKTIELLVTYKKDVMKQIQDMIIRLAHDNSEGVRTESANDNSLDQIQKLHDLLEKGIVTQEEFEAKKKQLLGL